MKHLLKKEYPSLTRKEYKKATDFIDGKCSQYYFLDYMRCSNGNVDDAIKFYHLDEELRNLLFRNIIRFEIQLKTDFAECLYENCHCSLFWKKKKYFMSDAVKTRMQGRASKYYLLKKSIKRSISHLHFNTIGPPHQVVMYTCSFGLFQDLFKLIDREYKKDFIEKYTSNLATHGYKILNTYIEAIRKIRNRCAHGNHIISNKILYELHRLKFGMREEHARNDSVVFENMIKYIIINSSSGLDLKKDLTILLKENKNLLLKYKDNHSLSLNLIKKLTR